MRKWIHKIEKNIVSKRGETLAESIVSLLIFAILMLSVTMMIQTALRTTARSTRAAREAQDHINLVILSKYDEETDITFSYEIAGETKSVRHRVRFNESGGIIGFTPQE